MSEKFVGKYERTSAENYEEFLSAIGVGWLLRKGAMASTPTMEVRPASALFMSCVCVFHRSRKGIESLLV